MGHNGRDNHAEEVGKQMPEEPIRVAHFDHVTDRGDLVFVFDHRHFAVRIDDTLERGLMEAKQIRAEAQGIVHPQASSALPISSIQSYIRAGVEPSRVAQRFSVSEALVRRFSAPIETEKKYAIEQFLAVAAPKKSAARTNEDLIEASLRNARINPANITWTATRRNHEPWHIHANFQAAGRIVKADWSWDMRDNSVSSLNATAKRLLGEHDAKQDILPSSMRQALSGRGPVPYDWLTGDASEELQESEMPAVVQDEEGASPTGGAAHAAPGSSDPTVRRVSPRPAQPPQQHGAPSARDSSQGSVAQQPSTPAAPTSSTDAKAGQAEGSKGRRSTRELTGWLYGKPKQPTASQHDSSTEPPSKVLHTDASKQQSESTEASPDADATGTEAGRSHSESTPDARKSGENSKQQDNTHRKSGRSAVPSWDEILFGD